MPIIFRISRRGKACFTYLVNALLGKFPLGQISFYNLLLWLCLTPIIAQADSSLLKTVDEALAARCLNPSRTAVSIVALPTGNVVYARNTETSLLPASILKLVTTAAALHYLGPEYRFTTEVLHSGQRVGKVIQGDLIIRGGGDPKLTHEDLRSMVGHLKESGISTVTGKLIVDTHFFDHHDLPPQADDVQRTQRAYDAKLSALSVNLNIITVHVQPGEKVGSPLNVWLEPAPDYIQVNNTGKTIARGNRTVSIIRNDEGGNPQIRVTGALSLSAPEKVVFLNVEDPSRYAAETFRTFLQQAGITIAGATEMGAAPPNSRILSEHQSPPLSMILKELNTYSNNFIAEQIIKTIAATQARAPGSHAEGLRLVMDFLRNQHINTQGVALVDGSGLSRKNTVTARTMTDLLTTMFPRFDIGPDFLASLRIMGAYGVASHRLANSPARGQIRAKTGTLNGVSTLAGYVASANGRLFAYALMMDDNRCGVQGAHSIQDRIVTAVHNMGDGLLLSGKTQ